MWHLLLQLVSIPHAYAHEVYVLSPAAIHQAVTTPSPNPFLAIPGQTALFALWFGGGLIAFVILIALSVSKLFKRVFDPLLNRLKKYAPLVSRLTLGGSLFASGFYHASFGPELPLSSMTSHVGVASWVLMIVGILIIFNIFTRYLAALGIIFFVYLVCIYHSYMLTYLNYFGEMVVVFLLHGKRLPSIANMERFGFFILRVCFGISVFFASFYAKFWHSNLALDTVNNYHLTNYFHFTPLFLVLGAFLVEAVLGLCFFLGLEVRAAALFFTFFLTLSILFFGESVWPHLILFGVNIALFCHGYDKYTVEKLVFDRHSDAEPVF